MANDTDNPIRSAVAQIAEYVKDVATMTVRTEYTRVDAAEQTNFDQAKPAALTEIKLDGDSRSVIPVREVAAGRVEIDTALLEVHRQNVATAIEYRARIMESLLGLLQSRQK